MGIWNLTNFQKGLARTNLIRPLDDLEGWNLVDMFYMSIPPVVFTISTLAQKIRLLEHPQNRLERILQKIKNDPYGVKWDGDYSQR